MPKPHSSPPNIKVVDPSGEEIIPPQPIPNLDKTLSTLNSYLGRPNRSSAASQVAEWAKAEFAAAGENHNEAKRWGNGPKRDELLTNVHRHMAQGQALLDQYKKLSKQG